MEEWHMELLVVVEIGTFFCECFVTIVYGHCIFSNVASEIEKE